MHFFRKSDKTKTASTPEQPKDKHQTESQDAEANTTSAPRHSSSDIQSNYDMEKRIREEAKRLRTTENLLSAPHMQRVQDTLRLNETKLANVEENLMQTREQKARLRRYKELQGELELQRAHLFAVHKQAASMLRDKQELDRFETFESVQGKFQRLQILEHQRRNAKKRESALTSEMELLQRQLNDEQKQLAQRTDECNEAENNLKQGQAAIADAQRQEGGIEAFTYIRQKAIDQLSETNNHIHALEKDIHEHSLAIEDLKSNLEKHSTKLQSTDQHQRMTEQGALVIAYLNRLQELKKETERTENSRKECERRQRNGDDMLSRVFAEYQQIEGKIKTIRDELHVHRQNILGQDSYRLQERAMNLKRRRQMLKSAQALWRRISTLYNLIEDKLQEINRLRLHLEHTSESASQMETQLGILRRSSKEKEYTFTLSKSQNVIQLRSDLKEGVSCTVCGATHHPYHSDTMLEQNKLIGELKTEAELLQVELRNKEAEMLDIKLELERTITSKRHAENELITLRTLQNEAVKDWAMFQELDSTFQTCDSTVNAEARTAMLRQLVENIEGDVKKAQEELDTYNFHQGRINELSEQMSKLELTRNELTTRMNEVNTSCQVLVRDVERLASHKQQLSDAYGAMFEKIEKIMTIPDWHSSWNNNHEGLTLRIQELTTERGTLSRQVEQEKAKLQEMETIAEHFIKRKDVLDKKRHDTELLIEDCNSRIEEAQKEIHRLLEGYTSKQYNEKLVGEYLLNKQNLEQQKTQTGKKKEAYLYCGGSLEELKQISQETDQMTANERSGLDVWIRQYNATHSPVQYNELANFFEQEQDWTKIREEIRSIDMEERLTQTRVDQLRSQMVALQAEGNIPDGDTTDTLINLAKQEEVLEKRRRDAMLLIATNTLTLQAHEKAEALIKSEKMKEQTEE